MARAAPRISPTARIDFASGGRLRPTGEGAGLIQAGQALQGLGEQGAAEARDRAERQAALTGSRTMSDARSEWTRRLQQTQLDAPEGAPEYTAQRMTEFDKWSEQQVNDAPELIRPWLTERMLALRGDVEDDALTFEAGSRLALNQRNANHVVQQNANTARSSPDQLAPLRAETQAMIQTFELPADAKAELGVEADERLVRSYLEGLNETDPQRARDELDDGRWDDALPAKTLDVLSTENRVELRRRDAEVKRALKQEQATFKAEVDDALNDEIALIRETGQGGLVPRGDIARAYGEDADQVFRELNHEKAFYTARTATALTSPAEDAAMLEEATGAIGGSGAAFEIERRNTLRDAVIQKRKALRTDPASYVLTASPDAAAQFEAAQKDETQWKGYLQTQREMQDQLGVPAHAQRLLGKAQATNDAAAIAAAAPEQMADEIERRRRWYGDEHWLSVMREYKEAGLAPESELMAIMDRPEDAKTRVDYADAIKTGRQAMKDLLPATEVTAMKDQVATQLAEFLTSTTLQAGGVQLGSQVQDGATLLAMRYMTQGMTTTDAAKAAADALIHSRYDFGTTYRVPKGRLAETEIKARTVLGNLEAKDMPALPGGDPALSDEFRRSQALGVAQRGYWVTNEDETGLYRVDQDGFVVILDNGERLEFGFDDPVETPRRLRREIERLRREAERLRQQAIEQRRQRQGGQ